MTKTNTIFKNVGKEPEIRTYLFEMQSGLLLSACLRSYDAIKILHHMTSTQAVSDL